MINVIELLLEQQRAGHGRVISEAGFRLAESPLTLRAPDVAFIVQDRIPIEVPTGFWTIAPDLVIEVMSPANSASDIQQKVLDYLDAGVRVIWVIDPKSQSVTVYRSLTDVRLLTARDDLDALPILTDCRCIVADLFAY